MARLSWTEDAVGIGKVCERGFAVERAGNMIPGVVWHPAASSGPRPLVLMGHGGSGHKRNERMVMLGRLFAGDYGWYAAAIDGPVHGGRGSVTDAGDIDTYFKTFAPKVMVPVLFIMQWDDERFERDGQLDLFDRLGAHDKRLHAYPGQHADNGPESFEVAAAFLKHYLEQGEA